MNPNTPTTTFSISELAKEFDITTRTIRFYEEKGLLKPDRNGSNRTYSPTDRIKLKLILRGKRLGFTLEESHGIIEMYEPSQDNTEQLQKMIGVIRDKRKQLEQQQKDIEGMMLDLRDSEARCLQALTEQPTKQEVSTKTGT